MDWFKQHWLLLFTTVLVSNMLAGTFVVKATEADLSWSDAAYAHFTSFATLGSNIPVTMPLARTYIIADAILGLLLIPAISGFVASSIVASNIQRSRERHHMEAGRPRGVAIELAKIENQAFDVITDPLLEEDERKSKLDELRQKARKAVEEGDPARITT